MSKTRWGSTRQVDNWKLETDNNYLICMITVAKRIIYIYSFSLYLFQGDKISQGHSEVINKMIGVYTHKEGRIIFITWMHVC